VPTRKKWIITNLLLALISVLLIVTAVHDEMRARAYKRELEQIRTTTAAKQGVEGKIMEWVVRRNPQATIVDFADFPGALLAEAEAANIDFRLILAIIDKESEFNPRAVGRAGEIGLMQIMPKTAQLVATNAGWKDFEGPSARRSDGTYANLGSLGNPRWNVRIGVAYLKDQVSKFGVSPAALRGYNRGTDHALEHRPSDRYAEDVALRLVSISQEVRD
jgi:hypothetical protein